jgi:putative transposase
LYVVIDLFSLSVLAWMVSHIENSAHTQQFMDEAVVRYGVGPGQLTIHQDRGVPMTEHNYLGLMGEFKVTSSHSKPRVSNDNPFSESHFKTCKYQTVLSGGFYQCQSFTPVVLTLSRLVQL